MIIEHRMYTFRPGGVARWLKKFEADGLPIQKKHLGRFVGLWVAELGTLNRTIMIWEYASLADREARRSAMEADPAWKEYLAEAGKLEAIVAQESTILKPASFSPPLGSSGT